VITGPYTLGKLSINRRETSFEKILMDFANVVAQEVRDLAKAGAELIQVEEPAILKHPDDFKIFAKAVEKIVAAKGPADLALYTYFGDAAPFYEKFLELPVDVLGFDFTYSARLPDVISRLGCKKDIGLGIVDGRNTRLEGVEEILFPLKSVLRAVGSENVYLSPSCGLGDYLPRDVAFKKLQRVAEITEKARRIV
jgi:5-methyltetrahydropteroyltriglutamate--homocysteine methyltransferase